MNFFWIYCADDPTPGHITAIAQAGLTRERFVSVFGEDEISSWGCDWSVLQDTSLDFDHTKRRAILHAVQSKLQKFITQRQDEAFSSLYGQFFFVKGRAEAVHMERLWRQTQTYFSELFHSTQLTSDTKADGVQLGTKIRITPNEGSSLSHPLIYYVKTHAEGRLSEKSTAPKVVDSKELFIYKMIELLHMGPQVHFLARSPQDVYS